MRRLVAGIAALVPVLSLALAPSDGGPLSLTPVAINASAGDQFDPHVSGDLAAYTAGGTIRYYNFFVGSDEVIPGPGDAVDRLSDVSSGKVVFSRQESTGRNPILVFDTVAQTAVEVDPQPFPLRTNGAIGSDTVAFIDRGTAATGELVASELGGATQQVTNDARLDRQPSVAPLGDVIVFESCATSALNCDVRQAARVGGTWTVTALTNNADPEANPDTDGVVVVYDATRAGERDLYWQSVGGDSERRLELPGEQRNPSVSAGVVAFESVAVGDTGADLFVYEIASNRLFRVTATPENESLNDVYVLADGTVRVVWASGATGSRDVYGATFELPAIEPDPTCEARTATLVAAVSYHKHAWDDGAADLAEFAFAVPAAIPAGEGNAANGTAWLSFWQDGGELVKCLYSGDGNTGDGATSSSYLFHHCTEASVVAGSLVTADHLRLRVQNADSQRPRTSVALRLEEDCPPPAPAAPVEQLAAQGLGCSSSGGSLALTALLLALVALCLPRRTAAKARSRRSMR